MEGKDSDSDFGFGFNDAKFSDRTLHLHLKTDQLDPNPKRCRLNNAAQSKGNSSHTGCSSTEMKTIHINSLILAAKSPFFRKLFSNGMTESNQQHVTLQIQESEEPAIMQLLKFMYTTTLSNTMPSALVDVLMAADKYEVASCMKYCLQLLQNLPMTCELALRYLDLPSTMLMGDTVQSLTYAAKEFLIARFIDISKFQEEMLTLPIVGIEAVLSSDDLQVDTEDEIFDFVMKWARGHYPEPDERREMLTTRLLQLIRFPFMSQSKLEKVLTCTEINLEHRSKLVFGALSLETPHRQRAYECPPVRVVRFKLSHEECVAYLEFKREECTRREEIFSQSFHFVEHEFSLIASIYKKPQRKYFRFGIAAAGKGLVEFTIEVEFSARVKPSEEFVSMGNVNITVTTNKIEAVYEDLHNVPWDTFIAENSPYFINGAIHLRAVLKIKEEA